MCRVGSCRVLSGRVVYSVCLVEDQEPFVRQEGRGLVVVEEEEVERVFQLSPTFRYSRLHCSPDEEERTSVSPVVKGILS